MTGFKPVAQSKPRMENLATSVRSNRDYYLNVARAFSYTSGFQIQTHAYTLHIELRRQLTGCDDPQSTVALLNKSPELTNQFIIYREVAWMQRSGIRGVVHHRSAEGKENYFAVKNAKCVNVNSG
jgi:hypothetical protein